MTAAKKVHPAVFTVSGIMALCIFGDSLLYSALPLFAEDLGIPLIMVGAILSINRWIRLISNPLAARTYLRSKVFWPVLLSVIGSIVSTALYAFPLGTVTFLAARMLWGFSFSYFRMGAYLIILRTSRSVLGLAMGFMQSLPRLGSAFTVIAGGVFIDTMGYQSGMLLLAALSGLALPMAFVLRRQMAVTENSSDDAHQDPPERSMHANKTLSRRYCYAAGFVTHVVSSGLVVSSFSLVLQQRIGSTLEINGVTLGIATVAGLVFSSHWLSAMTLSPLAGHFSDKLGRRVPFLVSTIFQGLFLFLLALTDSPAISVGSAVVFFVLTNAQKVFLDAALADSSYGPERNVVIGRYNSSQDLGAAVGPLVGYGTGALMGFESVYMIGAAALWCIVVAVPLHRRWRRD